MLALLHCSASHKVTKCYLFAVTLLQPHMTPHLSGNLVAGGEVGSVGMMGWLARCLDSTHVFLGFPPVDMSFKIWKFYSLFCFILCVIAPFLKFNPIQIMARYSLEKGQTHLKLCYLSMSIASLDEFIFAEANLNFQPSYLDEACETSFYIIYYSK